MDPLDLDIDWDQLSVGSNESFFQRRHPDHEPLKKALLKTAIEKWSRDVAKGGDQQRRQSRKLTRDKKPVAAVPPRGRSAPPKKAPPTVPVTPNVLKKRTMPKLNSFKPDPYEFKAKPAPSMHKQHKSCGNLNKIPTTAVKPTNLTVKAVTKALSRVTVTTAAPGINQRLIQDKENKPKSVNPATTTTTTATRISRLNTRSAEAPRRVRSNSAPDKARNTVPVTPMVLKRNGSRNRLTSQGDVARDKFHFKAKPAEVLHRKPFKPKLGANKINVGAGPTLIAPLIPSTKPFEFCLESRLKDRKTFNYRSTDAFERKQKQLDEDKKRVAEEQYQAARKLTNFRATRNPFK